MLNMSDKLDGLKVARSAKCRNTSDEAILVSFNIDYTGLTVKDVLNKAAGMDTIAGQRAWEKMTADEIKEKV